MILTIYVAFPGSLISKLGPFSLTRLSCTQTDASKKGPQSWMQMVKQLEVSPEIAAIILVYFVQVKAHLGNKLLLCNATVCLCESSHVCSTSTQKRRNPIPATPQQRVSNQLILTATVSSYCVPS